MSRLRLIAFVLISLISGIVYFITLCPTVEFIDSGELAMAARNMGIAHPTGYPLYTLLGRLADVFLVGSLIFKVNFLSLLFTAFAAGFTFLLFSEIARKILDGIFAELAAISAALSLAFSPVWWSQGTTNEVYSLNLMLIPASIWMLFKWKLGRPSKSVSLYLSLYILGLCLTNHLSGVYLLPGFLFIIIPEIYKSSLSFKKTILAAVFFLFPASLYLVLPIRAKFHPFLNWGGVNDLQYFYNHISGWQYRIWMFENPMEIFKNFGTKFEPSARLLYGQFGWVGAALIIFGLGISWLRLKQALMFGTVVIIVNLVYVLNYDIVDIESYYLPTILISGLLLALGLISIIELVFKRLKLTRFTGAMAIVFIAAFPTYNLLSNYGESDRSWKTSAQQGVHDIISSMSDNGLALVENWDFYSPWLYLHFAEGYEPEKTLLDKELMRRSWYIDFIQRHHPELYRRSQSEFEAFRGQIVLFERNLPYDPMTLDRAYYGMLRAVIAHERSIRPVYSNIINDTKLWAGYAPIPDGILFRFGSANEFYERPLFKFDYGFWSNESLPRDKRLAYLLSFYQRTFESRQKYCAYFARHDEEKYYLKLAEEVKSIINGIS